jgi:hypothetical protein
MPAIQRSAPRHVTPPIEILKDAIAAAREHGIPVRASGPPGVACASTYGDVRWEMDPLSHDGSVDVLGAVALHLQPPAYDLPDAVAIALDVPRAWVAGIQDGLDLAPRDPAWMASPKHGIYEHGFESAVLLRIHVQSYAVQA